MTGDVLRESGRELGEYYTEDGNPPGVWVGGGLTTLSGSGTVAEEQKKALQDEGLYGHLSQFAARIQSSEVRTCASWSALIGSTHR